MNNIPSRNHYRMDPKTGKVVCAIHKINCACPSFVAQLDKYLLPNCVPSSQPIYACVENCYYNKVLENDSYWIIMKFLENKTTKGELNNIHEMVIAGM